MKRERKRLKIRVLQAIMRMGDKIKILSYPIKFLILTYLVVYHSIRRIFTEAQYRRVRTGILTALCAVFLLGTVVVLPTLANETDEEPTTEVVAEEEIENGEESTEEAPAVTDDAQETEAPAVTEEPKQDESDAKDGEEDGKKAEESDKKETDGNTNAVGQQGVTGEEVTTSGQGWQPVKTEKTKVTKSAKKDVTKLAKPTIHETMQATGQYTYPLRETIKIGVGATAPDGAGVEYQWYVSSKPSAQRTSEDEEKLTGSGSRGDTYTVPGNIDAGDHYYYCKARSIDNDEVKLPSDEACSIDIVVTIQKGEPELSDFDLSAIKNEYYYTGKFISPAIVSTRKGMGDAYIVTKSGTQEVRPKEDREEPYPIYLHVKEGDNYKKVTLDLERSITIGRIRTPSAPYRVDGPKGRIADGKQWYTGKVAIKPLSGYSISTTEEDFVSQLDYEGDGTNQGPERAVIYLQNNSNEAITDAITVVEKRDGLINIDGTKPEAVITAAAEGTTPLVGTATRSSLTFDLAANDAMSGVSKRFYYLSTDKEILSDTKLKTVAWKEWLEGDTISTTDGQSGYVTMYAKVEDKAGNVNMVHSEQYLIDRDGPTITCGKKQIEDEKTYVADKKNITVSDKNLIHVNITQNGVTTEERSGDDLASGVATFALNGPAGSALQVEYIVTAEDVAGNQKVVKIVLKNPAYDVETTDLDFGSDGAALVYGYAAVTPRKIVLRKQETGEAVPVDEIEIEEGDKFELVSGQNAVRPKQGLGTGTYEAVIRIYYDGEDRATTTCHCTVEVKKAPMKVRYKGETIGYHTRPSVRQGLEFAAEDFKNGDTLAKLQADPNFVLPSLYYQDENGEESQLTSDMYVTESMRLIPRGGQASNYEFDYGDGELIVERREIRRGYVIDGQKVEGYDWYTSSPVSIRPIDGYAISRSDEVSSFDNSEPIISVSGPLTKAKTEKFYVMDRASGEISKPMTEKIRIDNTPPHLRNGEGITISSNLFMAIGNEITFGIFFNDTKSVGISATDEESGLASIQYYISDKVIDAEALTKQLPWKTYDGEFSISPEECDRAIIYAKLTNHAGLSTYISSNGMIFDNKQPEINCVENGKEHSIIDEKEYVTEELDLKVVDRNLTNATLFSGTNTAASGSALKIVGNEETTKTATRKIACPVRGSKTYTVVASDGSGNNTEREFKITKPIYSIEATPLRIKTAEYGYEVSPQTAVVWEDGSEANARATVSDVELSNERDFEVKNDGSRFWIAAKRDLTCGNYTTRVVLTYNAGKKAETTCSFTVDKAVLTATYVGDDVYYHEKRKEEAVRVTGFVKHDGELETPETAAGYQEPVISEDFVATETRELTPEGGKADNYRFEYRSGLMLVDRRHATTGKEGQYTVEGEMSDSGWYTSDIVIRPKEGYALLMDENDTESKEEIKLTKDTNAGEQKFFIMNKETGEIYYPSTLCYKKDTVLPAIEGIKEGETYDANTKPVTVKDTYLTSVTVNGESRPVKEGKAEFSLTADQETMVYVVVATDCAGNVSDSTIVLNQPESLPVPTQEPEDSYSEIAMPSMTPIPGSEAVSKEGTIKKMVKVVKGAPNTSFTTSTDDLKKSVLTTGEQQAVGEGSDANIELRIKNIDSSVPQRDKELVISHLNGYSVAEYLDITLWKKVGSSSEKQVTVTNQPVSVTISVPAELRGGSRQFVVFRVHDGGVTQLADQDSAANTVTISTNKFSTYVLAYKKVSSAATVSQKTSANKGSGRSGSGSGSGSGSTSGISSYSYSSPETGDEAPIIPVSGAFFAALLGIVGTMIWRKKINAR